MTARYELPPGTALRVTASSGDVTVIAEARPDVEAPEDTRVQAPAGKGAKDEQGSDFVQGQQDHGPFLEIRSPRGGSADLEVRCPSGTPISVGTISGDVRLIGDFGSTRVATTSGDISVGSAAALDARSVSGDLDVETCNGRCELHTKSGHIQLGDSGPVKADTVSGGVRLRDTAGGVTVRTVSGNVELGTDGSEAVTIRTVSGRIVVRVPRERLPDARLRSLSGSIECNCPLGSDFPLRITSVSGEIEVEPS